MTRREPGLVPDFGRDAVVLAIVALFGILDLAFPFEGDQALYALGAQKIAHGAALYRDFWDLKQPGIYAFYLAGGALFGFHDFSVHVFELAYWLALAAALQLALRWALADVRLASFAPLLVVVPYYAGSAPGDLTQVEPLAGFPLFVFLACALALADGRGPQRALAFVAGLAAGVALLWKLLFVAVVVAIGATIFALRPRVVATATVRQPRSIVLAAIGGVLLPLAAFAGYALANNELGLVARTFFEIPVQIARDIPAGPLSRLAWSAREFARNDALVIALAAIGVWRARGDRARFWRAGALGWIGAAGVVIAVQRQSWWPHHFALLLVPMGILALLGFETVVAAVRGDARRIAAALALGALLVTPLAVTVGRNVARLAASGYALRDDARLAYQAASSAQAAEGIEAATFLRARSSAPGDIYVAGVPTVYTYSGREQAIALNGWSLEFFVDDQWGELYRELAAAEPPYVYVSDVYRTTFPAGSPQLARWFRERYRVALDRPLGTWFERRADARRSAREARFRPRAFARADERLQ